MGNKNLEKEKHSVWGEVGITDEFMAKANIKDRESDEFIILERIEKTLEECRSAYYDLKKKYRIDTEDKLSIEVGYRFGVMRFQIFRLFTLLEIKEMERNWYQECDKTIAELKDKLGEKE